MSHELVCGWLGLRAEEWPPNHYRLLGLEPGEANVDHIEQQVHERLELVRRYQLMHPDQVTEAMNRLAQAFVCLTDPRAKQTYDEQLLGKPVEAAVATAVVELEEEKPGDLDWLYAPPPLTPAPRASDSGSRVLGGWDPLPARPPPLPEPEPAASPVQVTGGWDPPASPGPLPPALPPPLPPPLPSPGVLETIDVAVAAAPTEVTPALAAEPPEAIPVAEAPPEAEPVPQAKLVLPESVKLDPSVEAGRSSKSARRGLGTKRALYRRLARTRQLLHAWQEVGKYLKEPKRRLTRPAEATDVIRQLTAIRTLLEDFPPLLGKAGQPGYLVMTLARQQVIVPTFQTLLPSQREALARDWRAGETLLTTHRDFLRQESKVLRKKSALGRAVRAVRTYLNEEPAALLVLLALVSINVALWKTYVTPLVESMTQSAPSGPQK